jgi:uncharacterized protein YecE (DUF72 family)
VSTAAVLRVGPAGWSYADWEGVVYPREKPRGFHPLRHLARFVDCVELNSSFYSLPRAEYAARWVRIVREARPDGEFRFTAKLHRGFTHEPLPAGDAALATAARGFREGLAPLSEAGLLAAVLVQFPVSFHRTEAALARLACIRELFPTERLVLEVRHASWFGAEAQRELERSRYSLAAIDLPPAADHPPEGHPVPSFSGSVGYLRAHGRNARAWFDARAGRDQRYDYLYSAGEVLDLARTARRLAAGQDETYVVTNNHFSGKALVNALELLAELSGTAPLAPAELVEAYPRLREVVRVEGQGSLW